MAQTKDLYAAMQELKKHYKTVLKEAVQYATEEAQKDVYTKALTCLEEYYANYDPSSYKRSESLQYAFVPYMNIQHNSDYITSTVGVEYNADMLAAYAGTSYSASKKYGIADANWVIDNYLDGIHPITDGSSIAGEAVYMEILDPVSPTEKMDTYLEQYAQTFRDNINAYLAAYLMQE
jgi:hypothetical protein